MSATISITETQAFTVLRAFILTLVDCEVIRALRNRVAMPVGEFIELTPSIAAPLSTDVQTYDRTNNLSNFARGTQFSVQIDCYGEQAMDRANVLSMLLRSDYACQQFATSGLSMQPLYAGDAHQMPFISGEDQYMERWTFDAVLQINPVVSVPQQFADSLEVGLIDVDVVYPP